MHAEGGRETAWVLLLDGSGHLLESFRFDGEEERVMPCWRAIFQAMLALPDCHALFLCHSHGSGNAEPSRNDVVVTRQLHGALRLLDIRLLDHVIVTPKGRFSFRDAGLL